MADQVQFKVDSKAAQADLLALAKALDTSSTAAVRHDKAFAAMALNANVNLTKAAKAMEKYAAAANLLSKIDIGRMQAGQLRELGNAMDSIGRARTITLDKITALRGLGAALKQIRMPERLTGIIPFLNELGRVRAPTATTIKNIEGLFIVLNRFKDLSTPAGGGLASLFRTISMLHAPNKATIDNLERLFVVLGTAKEIPGATRIVVQLDAIATAATRAARALAEMPRTSGLAGIAAAGGGGHYGGGTTSLAGAAAASSSNNLNKSLDEAEKRSNRARASFSLLGRGLGDLSGRFRLTYQANTLLNAAFGAITIGQFLKSLYEANIQFLKLQKAVLFATGSFDGANKATDQFIGISQKLGLSIKDNIETYGRFVIAATASGLPLKQINTIYQSIGTAMTVVGASAVQQQLAFYGLTEMMQKGVVYSKEFNRQIGAQLPGNAVLGAAALSKLQGHFVSVSEFFKQMHSGTLLSASFVPAWAKAVNDMYAPLLPLAQQRPDVAVTRLGNSFRMFAREVGQGGFMTAIGRTMSDLTNKFTTIGKDGLPVLTDSAKKMADEFGRNLANAVRSLGQVLAYLAGHIDQIILGIKVMAAFSLAHKIVEWGTAAYGAAKGFEKLAGAITASNTASSSLLGKLSKINISLPFGRGAVAATTATTAATTVAGARGAEQLGLLFPPALGQQGFQFGQYAQPARSGLALGMSEAEQMEMMAAMSVGNGVRGLPPRQNALQRAGSLGSRFLSDTSSGAKAGSAVQTVEGATTGLARLMSVLGAVGAAAGGVALALGAVAAALGAVLLVGFAISGLDAGKTKAGNQMKYGDIEMSALSDVWDQTKGVLLEVGNGIGDLAKKFLGLFGVTGTGGQVFAKVIATLEALFGGLYLEVSVPARAVIAIFKSIFDVLKDGAIMVTRALSGDFKGAGVAYDTLKKDFSIDWKEFGKGVSQDAQGANINNHLATIMGGAEARANTRGVSNNADSAAQKQTEAAIMQQKAAQANVDAAELMKAMLEKPPSATLDYYKDIRPLFAGIVSGTAPGMYPGRPVVPSNSPYAPITPPANYAPQTGHAGGTMTNDQFAQQTEHVAYGRAWGYYGTQETGAGKSALEDLFGHGGINIDPEKTAWCAAFVNSVLAEGGIKGTGSLAASSFKNYGTGTDKPVQGDIVVLKPQAAGDTGHVGFFSAFNKDGSVAVLGGNQSNQVKVSNFAADQVVGYRRLNPYNTGTATPEAQRLLGQRQMADFQTTSGQISTSADSETTSTNPSDAILKSRLENYKSIQNFIGAAGPMAQAEAEMQSKLATLQITAQKEIDNANKAGPKYKSFITPEILAQMDAAYAKIARDLQDVADPLGKINRLQQEGNQVSLLRIKGLNDEADIQAKVNEMREQGYSEADINKYLATEFAIYKQVMATSRAYETILGLQKEMLGLDVKRLEITSKSAYQNNLNTLLGAQAQPGETSVAQITARLNQTPGGQQQLAANQAYAQAQTQFDSASATKAISDQLGAQASTYGLNDTDRQLQEDYRTYLQQITHLTTSNLTDLEAAAGEAGKAFAADAAKLKQQLENPPGFQKWVDGLEPFAKRMEDIKASFMDDLSSGITDSLSGDTVDWAGMAKDLNKQFIKAQVDQMLSGSLKALGLAGDTAASTPEGRSIQAAAQTLDNVAQTGLTSASVQLTNAALALQQAAVSLGGAAAGTSTASSSVANAAMTASGIGNQASQALSGITNGSGPVTPPVGIETVVVTPDGGGDTSALMQQIQQAAAVNAGGLNLTTSGNYSSLINTLPNLNLGGATSGVPTALDLTGGAMGGTSGSSGLAGMFGGGAGGGSLGGMAVGETMGALHDLFPGTAPDGNKYKSNPGAAALGMFGLVGNLLGSILFPMQEETTPTYHMPNGIIGAMSTNTVSANQVAAQPNMIGSILSAAVGIAGAMAGQGATGGGGPMGAGGFFSNMFNGGGGLGSSSNWLLNQFGGGLQYGSGIGELADVPAFAHGTHNTSGIPAMVHPNEAIIPLSGGRRVPVEMRNGGGDTHLHSTVNVSTPDVGGFRKSRASISRDQNRILKRNAIRNQPSYR